MLAKRNICSTQNRSHARAASQLLTGRQESGTFGIANAGTPSSRQQPTTKKSSNGASDLNLLAGAATT